MYIMIACMYLGFTYYFMLLLLIGKNCIDSSERKGEIEREPAIYHPHESFCLRI